MGGEKMHRTPALLLLVTKSHKVLNCVHVTKTDDPVTQRDENHGTEKNYRDLDQKQVSVKVHTHDRNLAINELVKVVMDYDQPKRHLARGKERQKGHGNSVKRSNISEREKMVRRTTRQGRVRSHTFPLVN